MRPTRKLNLHLVDCRYFWLVPRGGLEPPRPVWPADCESDLQLFRKFHLRLNSPFKLLINNSLQCARLLHSVAQKGTISRCLWYRNDTALPCATRCNSTQESPPIFGRACCPPVATFSTPSARRQSAEWRPEPDARASSTFRPCCNLETSPPRSVERGPFS